MSLRTLYLLRIFFRLLRMVLAFFVLMDGAIVAIGLSKLEFDRDLLIYTTWTALCVLLVFSSTEAIKIVSREIDNRMGDNVKNDPI